MLRWVRFGAVSIASISAVIAAARRDSMDPARCGAMTALGSRCCAEGQMLRGTTCVGTPHRCPVPLTLTESGCVPSVQRIALPGGKFRAGAGDWEAEGRVAEGERVVAPFAIDSVEITAGSYAECVDAGACAPLPIAGEPGRAAGGLARSDAETYCAFRGGRLPTHDEWTFAAAGPAARRYPWGDTGAVCRRGSWGLVEGPCGFGSLGPEIAALHLDGATPEGVLDLAGNVSEWVAGSASDVEGVVRGGSFATVLATDLRTWQAVRRPTASRSPEIGARCAYDVADPARGQSP